MELVSNLSFIEAASEQLISAKCCLYNIGALFQLIAKFPPLKSETMEVINQKYGEMFNAFLISCNQATQPCIIYLHGLSSYCFQGHFLLEHLQNNYSLCLFDLRSHGKNKNPMVTYGVKEAEDLYSVIKKLISKGIKQFYLWGRSMGASTILHFLNIYGNQEEIKQSVKNIVLDSPFSSFEKIAKETTANSLKIPHFICSPLVSIALNRIFQKYNVDLRIINFQNLKNVKYPAIIIYSQKDEVVNWEHSNQIIEGYGGKIIIVKGQFLHNQPRPNDIIQKALKQIKRKKHTVSKSNLTGKQTGQRKGLSISLISNKNLKQQKQNSPPTSNVKIQQNEQKAVRQLSPRTFNKMNGNYFNTPNQLISLTIKRQFNKQNGKNTTSQKVQKERGKSRNTVRCRQLLLTNTRYI